MPPGIRIAGRKKGVPNRRTLELADRLKDLGFDLVAETFKDLAMIDDPHKRCQIKMRMWAFVFPTRGPQPGPAEGSPVDVTPGGVQEDLTDEELVAIAAAPQDPRKPV